MADERFEPIVLKYVGLDADQNQVDLGQLGASIQGAARLLATSGHLVLTGNAVQKESGLKVRVLAGTPLPGSYEIPVYLSAIAVMAMPYLPEMKNIISTASTKAVEAIVNHTIGKWAGRKSEANASKDVACKALEEMGLTSRLAIEAVERIASNGQPSVRQFVSPIGHSAGGAIIGQRSNGAFLINSEDRRAIELSADFKATITVNPETEMAVRLTELDLVTGACKISIDGDADRKRRLSGVITDPQVQLPRNVYSGAFDAQSVIRVRAKCQLADGEIEKIFISDAVA